MWSPRVVISNLETYNSFMMKNRIQAFVDDEDLRIHKLWFLHRSKTGSTGGRSVMLQRETLAEKLNIWMSGSNSAHNKNLDHVSGYYIKQG